MTQNRTSDFKYIIIDIEFIFDVGRRCGSIAYSPSTLRKSVDGSKFIIKYAGEQPHWVFEKVTKDMVGLREYSHDEMIQVLNSPEW
jgi:hypothetical protein